MSKQSKLFLSLELLQNFCLLSFKDIQSVSNFGRNALAVLYRATARYHLFNRFLFPIHLLMIIHIIQCKQCHTIDKSIASIIIISFIFCSCSRKFFVLCVRQPQRIHITFALHPRHRISIHVLRHR